MKQFLFFITLQLMQYICGLVFLHGLSLSGYFVLHELNSQRISLYWFKLININGFYKMIGIIDLDMMYLLLIAISSRNFILFLEQY